MAQVVMSAKPKRVREFMINGKLYAGGAEEYYNGMANEVGGTGPADRVQPPTGK